MNSAASKGVGKAGLTVSAEAAPLPAMPRRGFSPLLTICLALAGGMAADAQETAGSAGLAVLVRSQGDERAVKVGEELAALRSANAKLVGDVRRAPVDFATAIARVHERARAIGGPAALAPALKALPRQDAGTLRLLAARELVKGRTSGMLLLLLAAYDREPDSNDALADLAGALAGMGWVNEALACLDELARRKAMLAPPMGIAGESLLAYVRGYCLVRLGEVKAARPLLTSVVAKEPMLAEAARLMAVIGETEEEQRKYFLLGVWRHRSSVMVCAGVDPASAEPDAMREGEEVAIDIRSLVDMGKAKTGKLPDITYARSVLHANGLAPVLEAAKRDLDRKFSAILQQRKTPRGFLLTEDDVVETWGHRMARVVHTLDYRDRRIRDLERVRRSADVDALKELRKIEEQRSKEAYDAAEKLAMEFVRKKAPGPSFEQIAEVQRTFHETALKEARRVLQREETAVRAWFTEWHRVATAVAAQIGDARWHEYARLTIEAQQVKCYGQLLHLAYLQASVGVHPGVTKEAGETPLEPVPDPPENCNPDNSISISTAGTVLDNALPFDVGVELNCEGISAEVDIETEVPGVTVSTEFGIDTKGNYTAFVGPKVSATASLDDVASISASAKGGLYVTGNRKGITDVGVKYEVKSGVKAAGTVTAATKVSEGKVSFIPAPADGDDVMIPISPSRGR